MPRRRLDHPVIGLPEHCAGAAQFITCPSECDLCHHPHSLPTGAGLGPTATDYIPSTGTGYLQREETV